MTPKCPYAEGISMTCSCGQCHLPDPVKRDVLSDRESTVGPVDPMPTEPRVYTCYPLITFFAMDDAEAAAKIHELDALINERPDISTELTEECYRLSFDNQDDERWDVPDLAGPFDEEKAT